MVIKQAVADTLKTIGGIAFNLMVPVLAGYIAMSIGDRPALAVGFVGGMIAYNGNAGFLGGLVAGFVGGYIVVILKKIFSYLPQSLEGLKPTLLYPVFGILIAGVILQIGIIPYVAMANEALTNFLNSMGEGSKILLGAVLGGMVPPLAIAFASVLFKNKFTKKERESGLTNFIMGLCFITEGAIPFAAADPLRVIPSCVVDSALAGGLSAAFNCSIRAPHGGLFVLGVVGNPLMYLLAIIAGSVAGAILLGMLRKKID